MFKFKNTNIHMCLCKCVVFGAMYTLSYIQIYVCIQQLPLDEALAQFTESRWKDAFAICDLAMYNYVEVSLLIFIISFLLKLCIEYYEFILDQHV